MRYFSNISLNKAILMLIGGVCLWLGVSYGLESYTRVFGFGIFMMGIGSLFLGITDGFADPTPRGRLLFRIAVIAFMVGTPIVVSNLYEMAASE